MDQPGDPPVVRLRRRPTPGGGRPAAVPSPPPSPPPRRARRPARRWRIGAGVAAVVVLAAGVAGALALGDDRGDDGERDQLVLEPPTTVRRTRSSTTTTTTTTTLQVTVSLPPPSSTPVSAGRPAALAPRPTAPAPPGTDPPPATGADLPPGCRDSTDPACGPWYWDPDPGPNQPLIIEVTYWDVLGLRTEVAVRLSDADAPIACWKMTNSNGLVLAEQPCSPAPCPDRHGPWTPPPPSPGEQVLPRRSMGGGSHVTVTAQSEGYGCSPYGSAGAV